MTVVGFSRMEDLIGILHQALEDRDMAKCRDICDEMSGLWSKIATDDDSEYVLSQLFLGTNLSQAIAQLEVLKDESNFMSMLKFALQTPDIREMIRSELQ